MMEIKVNGMMCPHCEARVKKALEAIEGITEAVPSHETNSVAITAQGEVDMAAVKAAIETAGYEFAG